MSNQIIPFSDDMQLPAHLQNLGADDEWVSGQVGGFPVMSIKSKVFHIIRGEEKTLVSRPDDEDEPAANLNVVVMRTHKGVARTYYATQYEEGASEAPDCYSNDGVKPAADAEVPQCKTCAACPQSQWGSRITESGKKAKACSEVKRLAIASPGQLNDPMLLRVPPTSLRNWDQYVDMLRKRGVTPAQVITKIGFDHTVSHQLLTFKATGFITEQMANEVMAERDTEVVRNIVGIGEAAGHAGEPAVPEKDKPVDGRKMAQQAAANAKQEDDDEEEPAPKKAPAKKKAAEPEPVEDDDEEEPAPKKAPAKKKAAPVEEESDSLMDELESELDSLGFGDDE